MPPTSGSSSSDPAMSGPARVGTVPLIGRRVELQRLVAATGLSVDPPLGSAPDGGASGVVLLSGDAGIGKTRLLRELIQQAERAGVGVLQGHCLDLGDSAIPFQPFAEILAGLDATEPATATTRHDAVTPLLHSPGVGASGAETGSLFAAVSAALSEAARERRLLVIIEDLHWADSSTRHLVRYLLGTRFDTSVRWVLSYRSDDLHRRHPLRPHIAEWGRLPGVQRIELAPLSDEAAADLVRATGPSALAEEALGDIVRRAEGNAFFVEELTDAAESGASLPPTLADLLLVRLDRLDPGTRDVVRAVACGGSRVTDELLLAVLDLSPAELEDALRQAVDHKILGSGSSQGYAFRHALLAEVVHDDLLPGERRRLHRAYLDALTAEGAPSRVAEIAHHATEIGALDIAFSARVAAGDQAVEMRGYDVAALQYERALELTDQAPQGADLTALVLKAADACTAAGQHGRAQALLRDQLDQLPADAPLEHRATLLVAYGMAAIAADHVALAAEISEQAILITAEEPSQTRARAENLHANVALEQRRHDDAELWAVQARSLAQRLGLSDVVADSSMIIERIRSRSGRDVEQTKRRLSDLIATTGATGNVVGQLRATHHLAFLHHDLGELDEAQQAFLDAMERARSAGRPWAQYGFDGRVFAAVTAYMRGRWDQVVSLGRVGSAPPSPVAGALLDAIVLLVRAGRGDPGAPGEAERLMAFWSADVVLAVHAGSSAIELAPDATTAIARHHALVTMLWETWRSRPPALTRLAGLLVGRLATLADRAVGRERADWVTAAQEATDLALRHSLDRGQPGPEGAAWQARLTAEMLRLRWLGGDAAVELEILEQAWRVTHEAFVTLGEPYEQARSAARWAAVRRSTGDTDAARPLLAEARQIATTLGAAPLLAEIDRLDPPDASDSAGLTGRETEVLGHLVAGRTNGEIARVLFISPKTVSVHVSNLLAKLGAGTRTEAAAIARRRGLSS